MTSNIIKFDRCINKNFNRLLTYIIKKKNRLLTYRRTYQKI